MSASAKRWLESQRNKPVIPTKNNTIGIFLLAIVFCVVGALIFLIISTVMESMEPLTAKQIADEINASPYPACVRAGIEAEFAKDSKFLVSNWSLFPILMDCKDRYKQNQQRKGLEG
jgi:hypothetical protein